MKVYQYTHIPVYTCPKDKIYTKQKPADPKKEPAGFYNLTSYNTTPQNVQG